MVFTPLLPRRTALALLAICAASLLFLSACGDPDNDENQAIHHDANAIEIETRGATRTLLARWTPDNGWQDADGNAIDELPTPVETEAGLFPFEAGGQRASLSVRFFDSNGEEIPMDTLSRDDETQERQCTEYSARYYATDDDTDVIAWPLIPHPDTPTGSHQFVELADGTVTGVFHCNHVHIYPETAGTVDLEFVLWHIDHSDDVSDPITIRVESASDETDD